MFLARGAKCGLSGASGLADGAVPANNRWLSIDASATVPSPAEQSRKNCRRVANFSASVRRFMSGV